MSYFITAVILVLFIFLIVLGTAGIVLASSDLSAPWLCQDDLAGASLARYRALLHAQAPVQTIGRIRSTVFMPRSVEEAWQDCVESVDRPQSLREGVNLCATCSR